MATAAERQRRARAAKKARLERYEVALREIVAVLLGFPKRGPLSTQLLGIAERGLAEPSVGDE